MQTYDLTLKDLLMGGAPTLLAQAAGLAAVQLAPFEVPVVGGGRLDLFGLTGADEAAHVELQAQNDNLMHVRMLGYLWLALRQDPALKVRQFVLYVGRAPMAMPDRIDGPGVAFRFALIDVRTLPAGPLLASEHPSDIVMAFFAAAHDIKDRVREVVCRLAARLADEPGRLRDALAALLMLSPLRAAEPIVQEEITSMPITIDLETNPFASKFFLKGRAEGRADTLLRLLRRRFDGLPAGTEDRVRAAGPDQLDAWTDRLLEATSPADLFDAEP